MNYRALAQHLSKTCRKRLDAYKSPSDVSYASVRDNEFAIVVGDPIKSTDRQRHQNSYSFGVMAITMNKGTRSVLWHFYVIVSQRHDVLIEKSVGEAPAWVTACLRKSYDEVL
jgi:hypothetical protein